ncbi:MAG: HD domain-containing phosphohydrolase [Acidobacteriaceae bacterium]
MTFSHPMSPERILVVDDESSIRDIISTMLRSAGYQTVAARSGKDALHALAANPSFDLMISDMMMPEMDGQALLRASKALYPDLPIIMVTAVHDTSTALSSIRSGAYDYLLKPFEREQLIATVRRTLDYGRLRAENRRYQQNLEALVSNRTVQLQQAMNDLERSYDVTLEALGDALDLKDSETEGHSKRVTAFTTVLARAMGLPVEQIRSIARGAFLHDIGKMAIPDAILLKPGHLTPAESRVMREHCLLGYQILKKIPFLADAAEIVYSHQERHDGFGYPRQLKGDKIPLGARLFSVADTFDAITSDRPYRAAQSVEAARKEIARHSGTQFDPAIVDLFFKVPVSIWEDLRRQIAAQAAGSGLARIHIPIPIPLDIP